jgi:hypothetical protein
MIIRHTKVTVAKYTTSPHPHHYDFDCSFERITGPNFNFHGEKSQIYAFRQRFDIPEDRRVWLIKMKWPGPLCSPLVKKP